MNMQTVSLSSLEPSRSNPRKAIDRGSLQGLAASIRNDGRLQNLVVSPARGDRPCSPPLAAPNQTRFRSDRLAFRAEQRAEMQELRQKIQVCEIDKGDMIVKLAGAQAKITILEARVG